MKQKKAEVCLQNAHTASEKIHCRQDLNNYKEYMKAYTL